MSYRVFSRKAYRKVRGQFGTSYVPNPHARTRTIAHVATIEEARAMCQRGPANQALEAGREYRGLSFYEFTAE